MQLDRDAHKLSRLAFMVTAGFIVNSFDFSKVFTRKRSRHNDQANNARHSQILNRPFSNFEKVFTVEIH